MMFQIKTIFLYAVTGALLMPALSHGAGIKVIAKGVVPAEEPDQYDKRQAQEAQAVTKASKGKKSKEQKKKAPSKESAKKTGKSAPIAMVPVYKNKPLLAATPLAPMTPASASKKKDLPVAISPTTATYERSSINFNGLINHTSEKQSRLIKRVKMKTADKPEEGTPAVTDFEDLALKKREKPDYETANSAPRAPNSVQAPITVTMRNKK